MMKVGLEARAEDYADPYAWKNRVSFNEFSLADSVIRQNVGGNPFPCGNFDPASSAFFLYLYRRLGSTRGPLSAALGRGM